ncbi:glycerate kinase [Clostridium sp. JN-1]|uniref:glycerate kinase family protein n=1 Tax=Clostridium sp. JN-1 TaxID=2483110 RepID=UPI000F0BB4B9|nr:glycerate kinase [Clostridium sp. JN-1]
MKKGLNILLAPDSFKESMTAKEVCEAMERGIKKVNKDVNCIHVPMADGGEGTMQSLVDATNGKVYKSNVIGPLGYEIESQYGILGDGQTGIIEMASASGIALLPKEKRNPMITTTYGTGELIRNCLDHGIKKLLIGIGGSCTNDGGVGAIQALGGRFLDEHGNEIGFGGGELNKLYKIDLTNLNPRLKDLNVEVACDVTNPLCGKDGASNVFGPQKGAAPKMIAILDNNLRHYANVIKEQFKIDVMNVPGAGAAGGLGTALIAFLNGKLENGADIVIKYSKLEEKLKDADIVFTGEGSIDFQTQYGKTPVGVARLAKKYGKHVIAVAGSVGDDIDILYEKGIDSIFSIVRGVTTLDNALKNGQSNVEKTIENIMRLMNF